MRQYAFAPALILAALTATSGPQRPERLDKISNIVVIYAENRSFDNLYGGFPHANGWKKASKTSAVQRDRDGSLMPELPPVWTGLTLPGTTPAITQAQTAHLPNHPFAIDDPAGFNLPMTIATRDVVHRFYQNQMQIDGGKNDRFAAWSDSGALAMGYYDGSKLPMWKIAQEFTLADNFFMAAFGGSFLNHQWLICACTPYYPKADQGPAKNRIAAVDPDGISLTPSPAGKQSAVRAQPAFVNDGLLTPDFYAVNTMQPPYQPSSVAPAPGGSAAHANPNNPSVLPPQTAKHIGDLLDGKGVDWAWYSGAWGATLAGHGGPPVPYFQYHHQPFNYFADLAPGTAGRARHLKDAGLAGVDFIKTIDAGKLEPVVFYKPQGNLNEHPGYADVVAGDAHIADVIEHLRRSPQWAHMVVVITYDENGGFWDHVAPPKADRWGPGTRIPAIIVSPYARKGKVDHTQYDTTSILRLIAHRFGLPDLDGMRIRNEELQKHGEKPMGDLTNSLDLSR